MGHTTRVKSIEFQHYLTHTNTHTHPSQPGRLGVLREPCESMLPWIYSGALMTGELERQMASLLAHQSSQGGVCVVWM